MGLKTIYFRADGNENIGLGHVFRCLSIAQYFGKEFNKKFIINSPSPALAKEILKICDEVIEIGSPENEASYLISVVLKDVHALVLDGYNFQEEYFAELCRGGVKTVFIDDLHEWPMQANIVVNHAPGATAKNYEGLTTAQLFLGTKYLLLRKEFIEANKIRRHIAKPERLFVSFGGADVHNISLKALKALRNVTAITKINLVLGSEYSFHEELNEYLKIFPDERLKIFSNLSAAGMVETMSECDFSLVPPSSISLEALSVQLGIITGLTANNQKDILSGLKKFNFVRGIEPFFEISEEGLKLEVEKYMREHPNGIGFDEAKIDLSELIQAIIKL